MPLAALAVELAPHGADEDIAGWGNAIADHRAAINPAQAQQVAACPMTGPAIAIPQPMALKRKIGLPPAQPGRESATMVRRSVAFTSPLELWPPSAL